MVIFFLTKACNYKKIKGMENNFATDVYKAVMKIPKGKVLSYGMVATLSGHAGASRAVGTALHKNPDPKTIPCHRVVGHDGRLAKFFVFGGEEAHRFALLSEGVQFKGDKVDMNACVWDGQSGASQVISNSVGEHSDPPESEEV